MNVITIQKPVEAKLALSFNGAIQTSGVYSVALISELVKEMKLLVSVLDRQTVILLVSSMPNNRFILSGEESISQKGWARQDIQYRKLDEYVTLTFGD